MSNEPYSPATQHPRNLMTAGPSSMQPSASARQQASKEGHNKETADEESQYEVQQPLKSALKPPAQTDSTSTHNEHNSPDLSDTQGHAGAVLREAIALSHRPESLKDEVRPLLDHAQQVYTEALTLQRGAYKEFEHAAMEFVQGKKLMAEAQQEMAHAVAVQKAEESDAEATA
ncbi:hypothetical protein LTR95_007927 [Oleoguttula sp. CCFEE 5521]